MLSNYSDVFGIEHEHYEEEILPGDRVRTGANYFPQYEVIAVRGDKAWLRDLQNGADYLAPVGRCRKLAEAPLRMAAE